MYIFPLRLILPILIGIFGVALATISYMSSVDPALDRIEAHGKRVLFLKLTLAQGEIEDDIQRNNIAGIQRLITSFGAGTNNKVMVAVNKMGIVIASTRVQQVGTHWQQINLPVNHSLINPTIQQRNMESGITSDKNFIYGITSICAPQTEGGLRHTNCGFIFLMESLVSSKAAALGSLRSFAIIEGISILLAAIILWAGLDFLLTRRVRKLLNVTEQYSKGNLTVTSGLSGKDELASLGHAIDKMLSNISCQQQELRDSEKHFRLAFENISVGNIIINDQLTIEEINPVIVDIFGYSTDEVCGQNIETLFSFPLDLNTNLSGQNLLGLDKEMIGIRKNGEEFPMQVGIRELGSEGLSSFIISVNDITLLKEAQICAEEANKAKSNFLANMSHDLRTPLNAIIGFSEIIDMEMFGPMKNDKYSDYAHNIHQSSLYLHELVNNILDITKFEAREHVLHREKLYIPEIAQRSYDLLHETASSKGIDYILKMPEMMPPVFADRDGLMKIFMNVTSNAIKFTPNGGEISVCIKAIDGCHVIEVCDSGLGISEAALEKITQPFFREVNDATKAHEGSGLGLAIVKSLVDLHGGKLAINSKIGKGTMVKVLLPSGLPH